MDGHFTSANDERLQVIHRIAAGLMLRLPGDPLVATLERLAAGEISPAQALADIEE